MPTNSASERSLSVPAPSRPAPMKRIAADRQQRDDRGVDRAHQGLVDREVGGLGVACAWSCAVSPRCSRAPCRTRRRCRRASSRGSSGSRSPSRASPRSRQRVDARGDHEVVQQRDDRGDRHLPGAEVQRHDQRHEHQEDHQAEERLSVMSAPQLGPTKVLRDLRRRARRRPWRAASWTWSIWPAVSWPVWTRMLLPPTTLTCGAAAPATTVA